MNTRDHIDHIRTAQDRIQQAREKVRDLMLRQQERLERNRRFLDGLRD